MMLTLFTFHYVLRVCDGENLLAFFSSVCYVFSLSLRSNELLPDEDCLGEAKQIKLCKQQVRVVSMRAVDINVVSILRSLIDHV